MRPQNQEEVLCSLRRNYCALCSTACKNHIAECCFSVSLLSKKELFSSLSLGREPWEEWIQSKGVTGIRAPQGQVSVRMAVVWFSSFFFFFLQVAILWSCPCLNPQLPLPCGLNGKANASWISHWALLNLCAKSNVWL